ncbi:DUF2461 domain-containing protein [Hyphobacterium sp. CCMP332]|nr:DUF2461 domain-containing protein [Hyphobacterium sp. CCMP332]
MKKTIQFLKALKANNNREWFNENKSKFQEAEKEFKDLVFEIQEGLSLIDNIETESTKVFRIYRDVRFSNDKTPYHIHRSVNFKRATAKLRGGYYLKIKKGESAIAGGFFGPSPADILHIRKQIQQDPSELRNILKSKQITDYFGGLSGEKVKSAPRGFSKDDPAIDLLKYRSLLLTMTFSDAEVLSSEFGQKVVNGFAQMRPFFDYMSTILTSNLDGEAII